MSMDVRHYPLTFFVNGKKVEIQSPSPETTLLQYLRRTLLLPGTKEACGQGGCGSCTVMISQMANRKLKHFSANACLVPICYLHGMAVTTVEGVGGVDQGLHPIQKSLVESHGLQCGFCTPGMVMTMYTLFHNIPQPSAEDMERALEGNLCRCTGYRPIVDAFKKASKECPCGLGLCLQTDSKDKPNDQPMSKVTENKKEPSQHFIFPPELQTNERFRQDTVVFQNGDYSWYRPGCLTDLIKLKQQYPDSMLLMGCTSVGFLLRTGQIKSNVIICGSNVPELSTITITDNKVVIGSAVTMAALEQTLREKAKDMNDHQKRTSDVILECLRWIGADQIRNVATIGGHIMSKAPNHDLQTLCMAMGAQLNFISVDDAGVEKRKDCNMDETFLKNGLGRTGTPEILYSIEIPLTAENEYISFYKQPGRRGFDYAVVNAAMYMQIDLGSHIVQNTRLCFGNVDKRPICATPLAALLCGKKWEDIDISDITKNLVKELSIVDGCDDLQFKVTLCSSFLYKFYLELNKGLKISQNDPTLNTAIECLTTEPSSGIQIYDTPDDEGKHAVWQPIPNVGSEYIVSGQAVFIDDMPRLQNELFAALVTSTKAHAKIIKIDTREALEYPGVIDFVCHTDVPGVQVFGPTVADSPLFATDEVQFYGQIIGAILADTREIATRAAKLVQITYDELDAVYTIDEAIAKKSFFKQDISFDEGDVEKAFATADSVVSGEVEIHAQEHFYLEPHTALAIPKIEQKEMDIYSSTQCITEIQTEVSKMLCLPKNRINIRVRRLGGAFGGKGPDSLMPSGVAAVSAWKTKRPVRCVFDRSVDIRTTGKRNPVKTFYKAAVTKEGKILGLHLNVYLNAGFSVGLSFFVLFCALPYNSPYKIPTARVRGIMCKTNTPSNTAFRGFGSPQKAFTMEKILKAISDHVGQPLNRVKEINFVQNGDTIIGGMKIENLTLHHSWEQCKQQADYDNRLKEVEKFNRENRFKKRGVAMTPVVFNFGYPAAVLNQGYALVHCYTDGSVLITHGGIEMGQGINTKVQQVAATVLGISMKDILTSETSSSTVANTTESGGSFTADLNGSAVKVACERINERLQPYKDANLKGTFKDWVGAAYLDRVSLSEIGHYKVPGMAENFDVNKLTGNLTWYFSHSAACSEVEIDCLTGEHRLIKTDIVMDVGKSLNPAIDVGQIEGGFLQGYGLMTLEALYLKPNGQIKNSGPLDYKIPGVRNIPIQLNVTLLKESGVEKTLYSSKGIGEPPLLLGISVHTALEEAVLAARKDNGNITPYQLPCPATVDRIRMACCDSISTKCEEQIKDTKGGNKLI